MRYVKLALIPPAGGIGSISERVITESEVHRDAILHLNQLEDGTVVTLTRYRGDANRIEELLGSCVGVISHSVSPVRDGVEAYVHARPTETTAALLSLIREYEFVLDMPVEYGPDGQLHVGLIGEEETVRRVIDEIPDPVRVELEQLSDYDPKRRELPSLLTSRQREMLDTAVRLGYYEVPRDATHEDIADELGVSTTTVGEHLRKIEARMLTEIAR